MNRIEQAQTHGKGNAQPPRVTIRIADAITMLGIGRSKIYI